MSARAILGHVEGDLAPDQACHREQLEQRAFQHPDVGRDPVREEFQHAGAIRRPGYCREYSSTFLLQDAKAQFVVGRVQVHHQPDLIRLHGTLISSCKVQQQSPDDLLLLVHQRVEGMEELVLGRPSAMNCTSSTISTSTERNSQRRSPSGRGRAAPARSGT